MNSPTLRLTLENAVTTTLRLIQDLEHDILDSEKVSESKRRLLEVQLRKLEAYETALKESRRSD